VYDRIRGELKPGERLLWCGRPRGGIRVGVGEVLPGFLFLVFTVFAIAGGAYIMVPFGIGLLTYLAYKTIVHDPRRRSATAYGLTDRRVIVIESWPVRQVTRLPLRVLTDITLKEREDRSGTIACFVTDPDLQKRNKRGEAVAGSLFRMIVDARHVYDLLRDARARCAAPRV
jgi:hypothetical protein